MGFIMSPLKLIEVITSSSAINQSLGGKDLKWYLSKEGGEAYAKAGTLSKKVEYFYGLLVSLKSDPEREEKKFCQQMAYIIAATVDGTSKPYGKWPAIVDPNQNPLVDFARKYSPADIATLMKVSREQDVDYMDLTHDMNQVKAAEALAALKGTEDYEMFLYTTPGAYENLTSQEEDPELFLIERCIIFTFADSSYFNSESGVGPYSFSFAEDDENE